MMAKEKSELADILSGSGGLIAGIGSLLTGLAAILAVCFAKEPLKNYFSQKISQSQVVYINTCEAKKQAETLIEKSKTPGGIDSFFESMPHTLPEEGTGRPLGLYISPEYRSDAKLAIERAPSDNAKKKAIEEYWAKSLSKETKSNVKVELNGEK